MDSETAGNRGHQAEVRDPRRVQGLGGSGRRSTTQIHKDADVGGLRMAEVGVRRSFQPS